MKKISGDAIVRYLQFHTWSETAEHFKISEMTISRKLKRLKLINVIDNANYINLLKKGFNKIIRKELKNMKASELRLIFFILTGRSISLKKVQYIKHIAKIAGVKKIARY